MLEPGGELDLPLEPVGPDGDGELRKQHLQRDGAVVLEVASQVDGGHAAAPELALEHVAVAEGLAEVWKWYGHWPERGRCFESGPGGGIPPAASWARPAFVHARNTRDRHAGPARRATGMRVRSPPDVPAAGCHCKCLVTGGAPGPKVSGMDQPTGRFSLLPSQHSVHVSLLRPAHRRHTLKDAGRPGREGRARMTYCWRLLYVEWPERESNPRHGIFRAPVVDSLRPVEDGQWPSSNDL